MKKKEEIKQLDKLWKKMKKPLKAFLSSRNQEDLHQFRIQVKKLKAMLTLYSCEPQNKDLLKYFKPVKKVFKKAGNIRNAYLNLKLGEKHHFSDENFNHQQQQLLDKGVEAFKKKGSKYLKTLKKAHIVLQNNLVGVDNKTIRKFYREKLAQTESFFDHPTFNQELHNTRKNIKLLTYNQDLAADALKNKVQFNKTYLDDLQDVICQWHDHNLTIEVLSDTGKAEDKAISDIKSSNVDLEKSIAEQASNFREKVSVSEEELIKR